MRFLYLIILLGFFIVSCEQEQSQGPIQKYDGPLKEADSISLYYTEETEVKTHVQAPKVFEFESGDREFPMGIDITFYGEKGEIDATLRADKAFYYKKDNLWKGVGDVVIKNLEEGQQLNTEELFWEPNKENIYTEKFVTIREEDQVLYGTGLEAKQDFSSYYIKKVEGEFYLNEETDNE